MEKVAGAEDMGGTPRELRRSALPAATGGASSVRPEHSVAAILATRAGPHRVRHLQIALGEPWSRWLLSLRSVSLDTFLTSCISTRDFRQIWSCVGVVARRNGLRTAGTGKTLCRYGSGSMCDGGVACQCCLCLSGLIVCVFACCDFAGGFRRSGRLNELLRRNCGSSERVA